jgi:hypothetical protein
MPDKSESAGRTRAPSAEVPPPSGESEAPAEPAAAAPSVGESSDPAVHQLLAERDSHARNLAAYEADPDADQADIVAARDAIKGVDGRLAAMGYAR